MFCPSDPPVSTLVRPQASISIDLLSNSSVLELADEPQGWGPGDRLVVASTDFSMHQAEEFVVLPCPTCSARQVKVQGEGAARVNVLLLSSAALRLTLTTASGLANMLTG